MLLQRNVETLESHLANLGVLSLSLPKCDNVGGLLLTLLLLTPVVTTSSPPCLDIGCIPVKTRLWQLLDLDLDLSRPRNPPPVMDPPSPPKRALLLVPPHTLQSEKA